MNKFFWATICALSFCSVSMSQEQTQPATATINEDLPILQDDSAQITLSTPKTQYVGGEHIKVDIILRNAGIKSFRFLPDDADVFYQIEVINPEGKKALLLGTSTRRRAFGERRVQTISPNGSKTVTSWLSNIFDMTMGGTYKITVSKRFKLGNETITVKSAPITLEVTSSPIISEWQ